MHSPAIHDARALATPSQLADASARIKRLGRVALAAKLAVRAPEERETPRPAPFSMEAWIKRQKEKYETTARKKLLEEINAANEAKRPHIIDIQRACALHFGVSREDMIAQGRTANIVRPRQIAYYLSKHLSHRSLPEIGRRFGGRDHTSALYGIRKIERLRQTDPAIEADIKAITQSLGGSIA